MCPIWPLHIFLMYLLVLCPLWILSCGLAVQAAEYLPFTFDPAQLNLTMDETKQVYVYSDDPAVGEYQWKVQTDSEDIVQLADKSYLVNMGSEKNWTSVFNVTGNFLGKTALRLNGVKKDNTGSAGKSDDLKVTVIRAKRTIDTVFTYSVAILVAVIYINFGCALDWGVLRTTLKRPIGPAIGFGCQFVAMPLVSSNSLL